MQRNSCETSYFCDTAWWWNNKVHHKWRVTLITASLILGCLPKLQDQCAVWSACLLLKLYCLVTEVMCVSCLPRAVHDSVVGENRTHDPWILTPELCNHVCIEPDRNIPNRSPGLSAAFRCSAPSVWNSLPSLVSISNDLQISSENLLFCIAFDCSLHVWPHPTPASASEVTTLRRFINRFIIIKTCFSLGYSPAVHYQMLIMCLSLLCSKTVKCKRAFKGISVQWIGHFLRGVKYLGGIALMWTSGPVTCLYDWLIMSENTHANDKHWAYVVNAFKRIWS